MRSLVDGSSTVLLTTQYLDEADQVAEQVAVIDRAGWWPRAPAPS